MSPRDRWANPHLARAANDALSFVTADEASIGTFVSLSAGSRYGDELRQYLERLLSQRSTRPSWCVIGLKSGRPISRAALWTMPDGHIPTDVVLIDGDWNERGEANTVGLMAQMAELAREHGAEALQHHVDSPPGPPQYQEHIPARLRLMDAAGYDLQRDGLRWSFRPAQADQLVGDPSLAFRALPEVGEENFVRAFTASYLGTRDAMMSRHIAEQGLVDAARSDFAAYQELEYQPEWWELAYADNDALVGVVMAARLPSAAVLAYVGVVPEQRGRGYAVELVRRGTERLVDDAAEEVRGDCDRDNLPMVKAFQRAGFRQFARRRTFRQRLDPTDLIRGPAS
jgi:RimJ/RimL family protein N-acetyltransferase